MEEQKIKKIKEVKEELPQYKTNKIANEVAIRIVNVFSELKDDYETILKKLEKCNIKIVDFEDEDTTHYYFENTIYLSNKMYTNAINEELVIEYLHYLQDGKIINAFNEAVNYFAVKLLMQDLKERMNEFGIFFTSLIEGRFALLVNLIMQIDFLIGRKEFIQSIINNKTDYYDKINNISNGNISRLVKDFDKLISLEEEYTSTDDIVKIKEEIVGLYFEIQNYIMKFYFYYSTIHITEEDEIEPVREKLNGLQNYRGVIVEDKYYVETSSKILERLNNKEKEFKKKNSKGALAIIYENKFLNFIKKILSFNHN